MSYFNRLINQAAVFQNQTPRHFVGQPTVMGYRQQRSAMIGGQRQQQLDYLSAVNCIKAGGRLVRDENGWFR